MIKLDPPAYPEFLARPKEEPKLPHILLPLMTTAVVQFSALPDQSNWLWGLFRDERGENEMLQFVGPSLAYYSHRMRHFVYEAVRFVSSDLDRLKAHAKTWADGLRATEDAIIWRTKPEITFHPETGKYKFYCRLHLMPYRPVPGAVLQGEEAPEV